MGKLNQRRQKVALSLTQELGAKKNKKRALSREISTIAPLFKKLKTESNGVSSKDNASINEAEQKTAPTAANKTERTISGDESIKQDVEVSSREAIEEKSQNNDPVQEKHFGSKVHLEEQSDLNKEKLWKEAFPVGTEWDQYESVYKINWDFSNLESAFEEGGVLNRKQTYLFGCTEPQFMDFQNAMQFIYIPAVVAVTSPFPPSDKVGIKSVQMEGEMIVPMKEMKMDWVPYIPEDILETGSLEHYKCEIFALKCTQRRAALRQLNQERLKKYEYCLPYFKNPLKEDDLEDDTVLHAIYTTDGEHPVMVEFDWEMDEIEEYTNTLIDDGLLPMEERQKFEIFVKDNVKLEKRRQKEAKAARKKSIEEMDENTTAAYENIRFYKFYPVSTPDTPDIKEFKVAFINRYYGKANEVF